jgi:hypothetical protein
MIVLKFIIGVLVVAIPLAIIYRLGKWSTKDELYVDTAEVFLRGFIGLVLTAFAISALILIYLIGSGIVNKLI